MKIAITTSSFGKVSREPLTLLENGGHEIILNALGRKVNPDELVDLARDCDGIVAGVETYDRETITRLPKLKVISRCGVGLDNIDMAATSDANIPVLNTPNGPTQAVVELTLGLILDALRSISANDRQVRKGVFMKAMGNLLQGKTVGIIGFGNIGRQVGRLTDKLGCKVICHDLKPVSCGFARAVSLEVLLKMADIVSLHANGKNQILGARELGWLGEKKPILINTARGELIDEDALLQCLRKKIVSHACLDVFQKEPYFGPLLEADNVTLTPHIGSYAAEARIQMEMDAVENLLNEIGKLNLL